MVADSPFWSLALLEAGCGGLSENSGSSSFRSLLLATWVLGTAGLTGRLPKLGVVGLDRPGLELALDGNDEEL